jgi:hypothetical protein
MKKRLSIDEAQRELSLLDLQTQASIVGGVDFYYYLDADGNFLISFDGVNWGMTSLDNMATFMSTGEGAYGIPSSSGGGAGGSSGGTSSGGAPSSGGSNGSPSGTTGGTVGGSYGGGGNVSGGGSTGVGSTGGGSVGGGSVGGSTGTPGGYPSGTSNGDPTNGVPGYGGIPGGYPTGGPSGSPSGTGSQNQPGGTTENNPYGALSTGDVKTLLAFGLVSSGVEMTLAEAVAALLAPEVLAAAAVGAAFGTLIGLGVEEWTRTNGPFITERGTPFVEPTNPQNNPNPGGGNDPWPSGEFGAILKTILISTGALTVYDAMAPYFGWPPLDSVGGYPNPNQDPSNSYDPANPANDTPIDHHHDPYDTPAYV